jgi:RimJ/RimL family protein N-acetyltransferase
MTFRLGNIAIRRKPLIKYLMITAALSLPIGYLVYQSGWLRVEQAQILTPPQEIKGKLVTLRTLKEDYFLDFHNMFSSDVRKGLSFPEKISLNYTIRYLKLEMEKSQAGKQLMYVIFDNKDNKLVGEIEIREKNPTDPGQFGFWINECYRGGGRIQEATKLIISTYFKLHPDRDAFNVYVKLWNKPSYYALKKAGFKEIGYTYDKGKPDYHVMEYYKHYLKN